MKGEPTDQTRSVDRFVLALQTRTGIPVVTYDERLTTVAAKRALIMQGVKTGHAKEAVDSTAAAILLQNYLDFSAIQRAAGR